MEAGWKPLGKLHGQAHKRAWIVATGRPRILDPALWPDKMAGYGFASNPPYELKVDSRNYWQKARSTF
jgi:hypothetical protein